MLNNGMLVVLSGPSGVGKDAVKEGFLAACPNMVQSVSATTRPMREGERDGADYHFLSREAFEAMIARGDFLEYTQYNGNYYGTPLPFVKELLASGKDVLLKIEVEGARNVRRLFPEAVQIFLLPPSMQELWNRLAGRGSDTEEKNRQRFATAYEELAFAGDYDYNVVNDDLELAVSRLAAVYQAEKCRAGRSAALCDDLKKEIVL